MKALRQAPTTKLRHKLHNSLIALSAVSAVAAAGLLFVEPPSQQRVTQVQADASVNDGASLSPSTSVETNRIDLPHTADDAPTAGQSSGKARRSRHSVAMPFFSFSARS